MKLPFWLHHAKALEERDKMRDSTAHLRSDSVNEQTHGQVRG
jgi:hypothetical protein